MILIGYLIGAAAVFLFGMELLRGGLCRLSQKRLQPFLMQASSSVWKGLFFGSLVTIFVQSSSAVTLILVGLTAAKVIDLNQAAGLIAGANLGTCSTAFLMHFGMHSCNTSFFGSIWVLLPLCLLLPILLHPHCPAVLSVLAGILALLCGMARMQAALLPFTEMSQFSALLSVCQNPISGLFSGLTATAILQSSSACIAMLQSLSASGLLSVGTVLPIILGQNLGTCSTALLASVHSGTEARQAAFLHLAFNLTGACILLPLQALCALFCPWLLTLPADSLCIAVLHLICNLTAAVFFLPICPHFLQQKRTPAKAYR